MSANKVEVKDYELRVNSQKVFNGGINLCYAMQKTAYLSHNIEVLKTALDSKIKNEELKNLIVKSVTDTEFMSLGIMPEFKLEHCFSGRDRCKFEKCVKDIMVYKLDFDFNYDRAIEHLIDKDLLPSNLYDLPEVQEVQEALEAQNQKEEYEYI